MLNWYNLSWFEVAKELKSNVKKGLYKEKVEENRKKYGNNTTLDVKLKSSIFLFLKELLRIYSLVGFGVAGLCIYDGDIFLGSFIISILILCVSLFFFRSYNSEKKLKELDRITPGEIYIIRDGKVEKINAGELVIGDIVYLERGDIVPADLRLIECDNLKLKESAVTGDNTIIDKYETKIEDKEITLSEMKNMAFKSSFVMDGNGKGIVTAVGENTEIGKITQNFIKEKHESNIFEKNILSITNLVAIFFVLIGGMILGYGVYKNNFRSYLNTITLIYLILVPMYMVLAIFVSSGILKSSFKRKGIHVKGLSGMQRLASTNLIFIDKIGTLTEEKMYIDKIFTNGKILDDIYENEQNNKDNVDRILRIGVLCNDLKRNSEGDIIKGDLIERALAKYAIKKSLDKNRLDREMERIFSIPYDRDKRIRTSLNQVEDKYRASVRGSVDKLLERCTHIMKNGIEVEITDEDVDIIKNSDLLMSKECLYVEAFAYRNFNYEPSINENIESNLVFVGLIGFENPLKENIKEHINYCRHLAIKPTVVTEDNKISAEAFGKKIGLLNKNDIVLSEVELEHMEDKEIEKYIERVGIFSRISAKTKLKISSLFRKLGYKLAVTGNKFTDSPSFRIAHIGIAAGTNCTNITKKLGDMYVEDNELFKLTSLIEESRKLMKIFKDGIMYFLAIAISEIIGLTLPITLGYGVVISPYRILFINFVIVILGYMLVLSQHQNAKIKNYEGIVIDKNIFKQIDNRIIVNSFIIGILATFAFYYGSKNDAYLGKNNFFISLNLSCIILSTYFFDIKNIIKNKVSILLFLGLILFGVAMTVVSNRNLLSNLKMFIIIVLIQIIYVALAKNGYENRTSE